MSIYLLWGEDDFSLEKELFSLRKKFLSNEISTLNYRKLENPDNQTLLENLQTTGMMFGNLLIEVHSTKLFLRGANDNDNKKEFTTKLLDTLEFLAPTVNVIFICKIPKNTGKKIDGASKLIKEMKKFAQIQEFQLFKPWEERKIIEWIIKTAKEKDLIIKQDVAKLLFIDIGEEPRKLDNELNKLELLAYPNKTISKALVEKLCLSCDNIFTFTDIWLTGNKAKIYQELKKLLEVDAPQRILIFLQNTVSRWINLKNLERDLSSFEISKKLNIHEYRIKLELKKLSKHSIEKLIDMKKRLTETEYKIKTGKLPPNLALELML